MISSISKDKFNDYDGFVEKFKPKKTTDDCVTNPEIYEVVKKYVCRRWNVDPEKVVRPFWPGGDYKAFDYSGGKAVIDNPPFSILTRICEYYLAEKIPFFLFAPTLTLLSGKNVATKMNHVVCDCSIIYENGAIVKTSFVTSFGYPTMLESNPELTRLVNNKMKELQRKHVKELPKYNYPDEIVTAAMVQKYSRYGIDFKVENSEAVRIRTLDEQKAYKKNIFGGGLLLSEKAAAEKAAAEKAMKEKAMKEKAMAKVWTLSDRERKIVEKLSGDADG